MRLVRIVPAVCLACSIASPALAQSVPDDAPNGDGRRTMGRFLPNLGRSFAGVFSSSSLGPLAFGAAATALGSFADDPVKRHFQRQPGDELAQLGQTVGAAGVVAPVAGALFVAGRASHDTRFRAASYDLMQATIVNATYTAALKAAVGRPRPDGSDKRAFPSGHTSNAFAWAAVADRYYGKKAGTIAYAAAGLVGVARVSNNAHHVSDVLAGATLGYIVGKTVVRETSEPGGRGKRFMLVPVAPPSGSGVGLGVSAEF